MQRRVSFEKSFGENAADTINDDDDNMMEIIEIFLNMFIWYFTSPINSFFV